MVVSGLSAAPIDVATLVARIRRPDCGAVATFEGVTRSPNDGVEVVSLEYEAFTARAEAQLAALCERAVERWDLGGAVAVHRTGSVPPGEPSVVCAASAAHRDAAFEAARWLIDEVKATVAIWKKEHTARGAHWVGTPD